MHAVEDVVAVHHQRNCALCLPSNSQLVIIWQQQQSSIPSQSHQTTSTNIAAAHNNPDTLLHIEDQQEVTQLHMGHTAECMKHSEPWQIHDILKWAKQFSYYDAASVNTFPLCAQFNIKAVEYVKAISERQSQGLFVGEGMVSCILII